MAINATVGVEGRAAAAGRPGARRATVAIVMSSYNHARYLAESLDGISAQTRPADEVIIIDDGSTDDSVEIMDRFARSVPSVQFLRNPQCLGVQKSISRLLPLVKSDYLVWTAADDRLLPDFLERAMAVLERHPEAGLCFSETTQLLGNTGVTLRFATDPALRRAFDLSDLPEHLVPKDLVARMNRAYLPIAANTVIVKREAFLRLHGDSRQLEWLADSFAYLVIALRHGACVVPDTLAVIRITPGSYSHSMYDRRKQSVVLQRLLNLLATREYADIRRIFRTCPSNFSPGGNFIFGRFLRAPRDWDLLLAYSFWKIREENLGHRLGWLGTLLSCFCHLTTLPLLIPRKYRLMFPQAWRRSYWRMRAWISSV